jgi:hypothetical protein
MSMKRRVTLLVGLVVAGASATAGAAASDRFEACRYDGGRIEGSISGLTESAAQARVIARILGYTGLPANFQVMESPEVPNAAAVIVRGEDGQLERVIAYNESFMEEVSRSTRTAWAGTSILAHEIGHHLCGHTLLPGGSQPPSELEADSFSGFVLEKMGATLEQAQEAMRALGSDAGSATHPPKAERLNAIATGFRQAKAIEPAPASDSGTGGERAPGTAGPSPQSAAAGGSERRQLEPAAPGRAGKAAAVAAGRAPGRVDLDPILSASIPLKLDRFVYDEIGALRPSVEKALNDRLAEHAARHHVEVIVVFARSLRGKTADALAHQLMHQLSVGQADVSNGGCLLVCPSEKAGVLTFMPGLIWSLGASIQVMSALTEQYMQMMNIDPHFLAPEVMESQITTMVDPVLRNSAGADWSIHYTTLAAATAAGSAAEGKLARIFGVVTSTSGAPHKEGTPFSPMTYREAEILAEGGRHLTVRVLPRAAFRVSSGDKVALFGRLASLSSPTIELNSYAMLAR